MNILSLFSTIQSVFVMTAGLITLMEEPGVPGANKKAAVLSTLDQALDSLPIPGSSGTEIRTAVKALAPFAVDLLVAKANQSGALPSSKSPAQLPAPPSG